MIDHTFLIHGGKPRIESPLDEGPTSKEVRAEMVYKRMIITALAFSAFGFLFFLASYVVVQKAPITTWWHWDAGHINIPLFIIMLLSVIFCILRITFKIPALLIWMLQVFTVSSTITCLNLAFHDSRFPSAKWCRVTGGPIGEGQNGTIYPPPHCKDWKLALSIVMGTAIGCAIILCVIYLGELLNGTLCFIFCRGGQGDDMSSFSKSEQSDVLPTYKG